MAIGPYPAGLRNTLLPRALSSLARYGATSWATVPCSTPRACRSSSHSPQSTSLGLELWMHSHHQVGLRAAAAATAAAAPRYLLWNGSACVVLVVPAMTAALCSAWQMSTAAGMRPPATCAGGVKPVWGLRLNLHVERNVPSCSPRALCSRRRGGMPSLVDCASHVQACLHHGSSCHAPHMHACPVPCCSWRRACRRHAARGAAFRAQQRPINKGRQRLAKPVAGHGSGGCGGGGIDSPALGDWTSLAQRLLATAAGCTWQQRLCNSSHDVTNSMTRCEWHGPRVARPDAMRVHTRGSVARSGMHRRSSARPSPHGLCAQPAHSLVRLRCSSMRPVLRMLCAHICSIPRYA